MIFGISYSGYSQWEECNNGLWGGFITSLASQNNYIFAGINSGIAISSDYGNNWITKRFDFDNGDNYVTLIGINDNEVFVFSFNNLFYSNDLGKTWEKRSIDLSNSYANGVVFYKNQIIISTNDGLFESKDNGFSWQKLSSDYTTSIIAIKNKIIVGAYNGLYISIDDGKIWNYDSYFKDNFISTIASQNDTICCATSKNQESDYYN